MIVPTATKLSAFWFTYSPFAILWSLGFEKPHSSVISNRRHGNGEK